MMAFVYPFHFKCCGSAMMTFVLGTGPMPLLVLWKCHDGFCVPIPFLALWKCYDDICVGHWANAIAGAVEVP